MRKALPIAAVLALVACAPGQPPPEYASAGTIGVSPEPSSPAPQAVPPAPPAAYGGPVSVTTTTSMTLPDQTTQATPLDTNDPSASTWPRDILHLALDLRSVTPQQRDQIKGLIEQKRMDDAKVHSAHSELLNALANDLDSGTVSSTVLAPRVQALAAAIQSAEPADRSVLESLHAILSSPQRIELADQAEARTQSAIERRGESAHPAWVARELGLTPTQTQEDKIEANLSSLESAPSGTDARAEGQEQHMRVLEAFKGPTFVMSQIAAPKNSNSIARAVGHIVVVAQAASPVLTLDQRASAAAMLRRWAEK